jgi:hypothetical protein
MGRLAGRRSSNRQAPARPRPLPQATGRQATTAGTSSAATRAAVLPPYCLEVLGLSIIARCPAGSSYVRSDTQVTDRRVLLSGGGSPPARSAAGPAGYS